MSRADELRIHKILQKFGPDIVEMVAETGYFDFASPEDINEIPGSFWKGLSRASIGKNEVVWGITSRVFSSPALDQGIARAAKDLNIVSSPLSWHSQTTKQYFEERSLQFVKDMSVTDRVRLRGYLFSRFGDNEKEFAKFVSKNSYICDGNESRLRMIKRTETHTAVEGGAFRYAYNAGAQYKEWFTARDNRVRLSHQLLDGEIRPIDQPFDNGLLVPGEVNCRCHLNFFWDRPQPRSERMAELYRLQEEFKSGRMNISGPMTVMVDLGPEKFKSLKPILPPLPAAAAPAIPRFRAAKDIRECRKRLRDIVAKAVDDPLWKTKNRMSRDITGKLRPVLRFPTFSEEGAAIGKIKNWDLDLSNIVLEKMEELNARCIKLGIPPLRGITLPQPGGNFAGQMGDGLLGLSKVIQQERLGQTVEGFIQARERDLRISTGDLKTLKDRFEQLGGTRPVFSSTSFADNLKRTEIADLIKKEEARLGAIRAGLDRMKETGKYDYFAFNPGKQPYVSSELFLHKDRVISDIEHEFAHHIHQQLGVDEKLGPEEYIRRVRKSGMEPEIEQAWIKQKSMTPEMYRQGISYKPPTGYADKNSHEWFAENYSLYMMGYKDMVSSEALPIVERIVAQQGQGPLEL